MRISRRHADSLFALLMSLSMAFIMTGIITFLNTGYDMHFVARWLHAFVIAWPIAFVCIRLLAGRVRGLANHIASH